MSPSRSLYEPKLMDRWVKQYRDFEMDELVRSLRKARQEPQMQTPAKQPQSANATA